MVKAAGPFRSIVRFIGVLLAVWLVASGKGEVWGLARAEPEIRLEPLIALQPLVTSGLEHPVFVTQAPGEPRRLIIVEQPGRIRIFERGRLDPSPFLDIAPLVAFEGERGLLGLAFHPRYSTNGRFFVNYTRSSDGATVVAEYRRAPGTDRAQPEGRILFSVSQPFPNHNGGMIAFGPDGYLYIGMGDGGSRGDPGNRGQNQRDLLGKILRIDVDSGRPYAVPTENPKLGPGTKKEIFALGFRNPWRFSFDSATEQLWVADVGQDSWEEIDLVRHGGNYGWRQMEGRHCYRPKERCSTKGLTLPVAEYSHAAGRCSITGGYVYRGTSVPALAGRYLFGDFCSGEIFALPRNAEKKGSDRQDISMLISTDLHISSFGQDGNGEVYVVDLTGGLYRIVTNRKGL